MKNSMKRMLSAVMAITMVAGATSATAYASIGNDDLDAINTGTIEVNTTKLTSPVIDVVVPTAPAITVDPYQIAQKGQVYSNDATIINYSNVPMSVEFNTIKVSAPTPSDGTNNVALAAKALASTDTTNWVVANFVVTDGTNKATSTVLDPTKATGDTGMTVKVASAMAPLGGKVTYKINGTCNLAPATAWTGNDKISVSAKYKFTPNTFTKYSVTANKNVVSFDKTLAKTLVIDDNTKVADIQALCPSTLSNSGKELPVVWKKYTPANGDTPAVIGEVVDIASLDAVPSATTTYVACVPEYKDIYTETAGYDAGYVPEGATAATESMYELASGVNEALYTVTFTVPTE